MMRSVAILLALASASAFSPSNPASWTQKSTVVQNTIKSKWTMMPDEPMPEVSSTAVCAFCGWRWNGMNRVVFILPRYIAWPS